MLGAKRWIGEHREVYECFLNPKWVVKIEYGEASFANAMEWKMWQNFKGTKWGGWFAPVRHISACGQVLIMDKCEPLEERPHKVPAFFSDMKRQNWGQLNGKAVCLDYGNTSIFRLVADNSAMVVPVWHDLKKTTRKRATLQRKA